MLFIFFVLAALLSGQGTYTLQNHSGRDAVNRLDVVNA